MDILAILLRLFPPFGGGHSWPLPDEEFGIVIDEKGNSNVE